MSSQSPNTNSKRITPVPMKSEFNTDEVRRQLRDSRPEHASSLRLWRDALARTFDPASGHDEATKAQVLGLPARRQFLKVGGLTVAMSTVIAACGSSGDEKIPESGDRPTTTTTEEGGTSAEDEAAAETLNISLLRTAQSIEALAVAAYGAAIDSGQVTTPALVDAATLFQSQHEDHAGALAAATTDLGAEPYEDPNPYLYAQLEGAVAGFASADELVIVQAAADLEELAAQTYVYAAGVLSTPELRAAIMAIGTTEARHLTVLKGVLEQEPVSTAFMGTGLRIPVEGLIPAEGEASAVTTSTVGETTTSEGE